MWTAAILLCATGLAGCGSPQDTSSPREVQFEIVAVGTISGHREKVREVIATQAGWDAFWERHVSGAPMPGEKPQVDFDSEVVIAAVYGQDPPACDHVRITNVTQEALRTLVHVTAYQPPAESEICVGVRQPFHFVSAPRDLGEVTFEELVANGSPPSR